MEGVSEAYHIPFGLRLKGDLDRAALRRALDRILARHEALRTTFAFDRWRAGAADRRCRGQPFPCCSNTICAAHSDAQAELERLIGARSRRCLRSGTRSADPGPADPAGGRRACAADHHAPHRLRRLVDGRADQRTERLVQRFSARAKPILCRSWRSSMPTTPSGSGSGSRAKSCSSRPRTGSPPWPELRRCWSCPPTIRARRSRTLPGPSPSWCWTSS